MYSNRIITIMIIMQGFLFQRHYKGNKSVENHKFYCLFCKTFFVSCRINKDSLKAIDNTHKNSVIASELVDYSLFSS